MVLLEPHRAAWRSDFAHEAERLHRALGADVTAIEHIGSTAVPGLSAKPVIDVAAQAAPSVDPFGLGGELAAAGYRQHWSGPKTHAVYVREQDGARTHILHVFATAAWETCNQRLFRDKLLRDPAARERYERVKRRASGLADGREYTAAKSRVVQELLDEERAARGLPPVPAWDK